MYRKSEKARLMLTSSISCLQGQKVLELICTADEYKQPVRSIQARPVSMDMACSMFQSFQPNNKAFLQDYPHQFSCPFLNYAEIS